MIHIDIYIEPHERNEAIEAYQGWLSKDQCATIRDAEDSALIRLQRLAGETSITVIEEG